MRGALLRYNHSQAYAARVMAIAHGYRTSSQLSATDIRVRPVVGHLARATGGVTTLAGTGTTPGATTTRSSRRRRVR